MMFHGPRADMTPWFGSIGYAYDPVSHGVASDWVIDVVSPGRAAAMEVRGRWVAACRRQDPVDHRCIYASVTIHACLTIHARLTMCVYISRLQATRLPHSGTIRDERVEE